MRVKELIEILKKLDPELPVWTSAEYEMPLEEGAMSVEKPLDLGTEALVIGA